jgi:hypothetical protein
MDNRKKGFPTIGNIDITPNLTDEERFNCPKDKVVKYVSDRYRFFEEKGLIIMENRVHLTRQELGWNEVKVSKNEEEDDIDIDFDREID